MSNKRKLDAIMATGVRYPGKLKYSNHSDVIIKSAQSGNLMTVEHLSHLTSWTFRAELFEHYCNSTWRKNNHDTLDKTISPAAFELFIQWLYEQRYDETTGAVKKLSIYASLHDNASLDLLNSTCETMNWDVKAAILCWELGAHLEATGFQNYAMTSLFVAFSQPQTTQLTAELMQWVKSRMKPLIGWGGLQHFLEDFAVRNWGDDTVVDHKLQSTWSDPLDCVNFRWHFIDGTFRSIEKRREVAMDLQYYLIDRG